MNPVVLAHGFIGYRKLLYWELFPGVEEAFAEMGVPAFRTLVHPTARIEDRAAELLDQIDGRLGPEARFHVIGHSMGGLDGRYMVSPNGMNQGHRAISLTTLSTPHRGAWLAERIPNLPRRVVSFAAGAVRRLAPERESRRFLDAIAEYRWDALSQLRREYMQNVFNPAIIDHPDTRYFSYAAKVNPDNRTLCGRLRRVNAHFIRKAEGENDGMVSVESAKWGEFKGTVVSDHGELIGQRVLPWTPPCFDYIGFLRSIAGDLIEIDREAERARSGGRPLQSKR